MVVIVARQRALEKPARIWIGLDTSRTPLTRNGWVLQLGQGWHCQTFKRKHLLNGLVRTLKKLNQDIQLQTTYSKINLSHPIISPFTKLKFSETQIYENKEGHW